MNVKTFLKKIISKQELLEYHCADFIVNITNSSIQKTGIIFFILEVLELEFLDPSLES